MTAAAVTLCFLLRDAEDGAEVLLGLKQTGFGKGKIVVPLPAESQPSSVALRKGDTAFTEWVDTQLADYYKSGQTQKWYEQAIADFGLDPKSAPPVMKEMIK